jgi:hypothetical protein
MKSVTCKLIDQRRNELKTNNEGENKVKDLFDILVSENDPHTGKPFTDAAVSDNIRVFLSVPSWNSTKC